jgi:eukaryotic-like serine/threonine-protein kinase
LAHALRGNTPQVEIREKRAKGMTKKFQCEECQGAIKTSGDGSLVLCEFCGANCTAPLLFEKGSIIDDFVIISFLGEGAMGNVYRAHQLSLDRDIALKILKAELLEDPEIRNEFFHEARSVACLNHPNIIQAYKVGEENGIFFFAMEYVQGQNLADLLDENGVISETLALSISTAIVQALGYCWEKRQLLHRDIKPENIMLTKDGSAKLMDLGLSRRHGDHTRLNDSISGTPDYISPEQAQGHDMDIRGDFYSLGATLYHLLAGECLFKGSLFEIIKQHIITTPPPLQLRAPQVSDQFSEIIGRLLSKDPKNRYDNAGSLLQALDKVTTLENNSNERPIKKRFKLSTTMGEKNVLKRTRKKRKKKTLISTASIAIGAFFLLSLILVVLLIGSQNGAR